MAFATHPVAYLEDVFCHTSLARRQPECILDAKQLPLVVFVTRNGVEVAPCIFARCRNISKLLRTENEFMQSPTQV